MGSIGIKQADGTFYPVIEEGSTEPMSLSVTTAQDNQTEVHIDLYNSPDNTMKNAEYVDTLEISNLKPHPNGEPNLDVKLHFDENKILNAQIHDPETGISSRTKTTIVSHLPQNTLSSKEESSDTLEEDTTMIEPAPNNEDFSFEELNKETLAQQGAEEAAQAQDDFKFPETNTEDESLPDFASDDVPEETIETNEEDSLDLPDFNLPESEALSSKEEVPSDETFESSDTDFDLPDFGEETSESSLDTSLPEDSSTDFDLPDFSEETSESSLDTSLPEDSSADFDLPDFGEDDAAVASGISGIFDEDTSCTEETEKVSSTPMFDDLYDNKDENKKNKAPAIIAVIIILILLAIALLLFVIPSKFNILNKDKSAQVTEIIEKEPPLSNEDVVPEPENPYEEPEEPVFFEPPSEDEEPAPEPVSAKEDEIVIATTPVVPELPPAPKEKPQDIHYKIKWGDTLWDIANAYYKNPWRYHMLAKYNGIKDPDYIVSGTWIWIPAE